VIVERVAGEQHDIGLETARAGEHRLEAASAVAAVLRGDSAVIDMQIGAVDEDDLAAVLKFGSLT
jgi:hypothetical protein